MRSPKRSSAETTRAAAPWLSAHGADTLLTVHVVPRARHTAVHGTHDNALRIRLAAPPVEGTANALLVRWLAETCGVPLSTVSLIAGQAARRKVVRVAGVAPERVYARLGPAASGD